MEKKSSKLNVYGKLQTFFHKQTKRHRDLYSEIGRMCGAREISAVYIYQLTYCAIRKFVLGMLCALKFFFNLI